MGDLFDALEMPPHKYKALYGVDLPDYEDDNIVFTCYCGIRSLRALQLANDLGFQRWDDTWCFTSLQQHFTYSLLCTYYIACSSSVVGSRPKYIKIVLQHIALKL